MLVRLRITFYDVLLSYNIDNLNHYINIMLLKLINIYCVKVLFLLQLYKFINIYKNTCVVIDIVHFLYSSSYWQTVEIRFTDGTTAKVKLDENTVARRWR